MQAVIKKSSDFKYPFDGVTQVKIDCAVHGQQVLTVPAALIGAARHCPKCVQETREAKIKKSAEKFIQNYISESGLPQNSIGKRFTDLDCNKSPKQARIVERLIQYIKEMVEAGTADGAKNIMLTGNMGTGKTLYASIVLQNIARRSLDLNLESEDIQRKNRLNFAFMSEQILMQSITASWSDKAVEKQHKLIDRLCRVPILCLDDVGTVTTTQTHLLDAYAIIFDERYKRNLPTIITSNMTHDGLRLAVGSRAADRFLENGRVIVANFDWQGYRTSDDADGIEFF